jgi:hypothetical protein
MGLGSMTAPLVATITYCLNETGRKVCIKAGGSGSYHQNVSGVIGRCDLPLFNCSLSGVISVVFNQVEFDGPQNFATLLASLRERRGRLWVIKTLIEAEAIAESAFDTAQ